LILVVNASSQYKTLKDLVDGREEGTGQGEHGLVLERHHRPHRRRALPAPRGHQDDARALQGRGRGGDRPHGRERRLLLRQHQAVGGLVTSGRLRPLAVTSPQRLAQLSPTSPRRRAGLPRIRGGDVERLVAPAGTPPAIVSASTRKRTRRSARAR
jgi:hypothetical protein